MASPQLVWQLVKDNNCYLRKNVNNTWFSAEPNNVAHRHSYKFSGAARPPCGYMNCRGDHALDSSFACRSHPRA